MKKIIFSISLAAALLCEADVYSQVVVDAEVEVGGIKPMNAVNNGPKMAKKSQTRSNYEAYKAAGFPYARLHDAPIWYNWGHTVDVSCVFPNFDADENSPASYDFTLTDKLLSDIQSTGTKVFYRLGQSIEHWGKKYGANPPKDYKKWSRICEHIVRHYNEGWADGFRYGIEYWEIWNEPDLGFRAGRHLRGDSPTWNGTDKDYFRLYEITARHLKNCFPSIKVGGPALCEDNEWADNFLAYASSKKLPLDFFSYHLYAGTVKQFVEKNRLMKSLLDKYGYGSSEMILDEWNYLANWTDEFVYTMEVIVSHKGAAFASAIMQASQDGPADMLMYYDARPSTGFNGLFDDTTDATLPAYYSLYSWKKLRALGTQVRSDVGGLEDVYVTAAKSSADGRLSVLVTYYTDNKEKVAPISIDLDVRGFDIKESVGFVTDKYKLHTETPVAFTDGRTTLSLLPNSYIFIELR